MTIIKKILKYALNIGLILVITLFTLNLIFKDQELSEIISDLRSADPLWITIGAAAAVLFVSGESSIIHYMLRVLDQKTSFLRCLKYSFIGFFFSYITPSSTGGQPMQMYHMKKDKIKIGYSTLIMLLITIAYKSILVLLALGFLIFNYDTVALYAGDMKWLIVLGFTLNLSFIILLLLVFLKPIWARALGIKTVDLLTKLHIMKRRNKEKYTEKLIRICDTYAMGADYIKKNLWVVFNVFVMTALQRICLFSITWIIYKAYGMSGTSYIDILTIQIMIAVAVEMLPLPGAAGITEGCFLLAFTDIFTLERVKPALLISRGLNFYLILFIGAIVSFAAHILNLKRDRITPDLQ
ncbi:lysylphosphatidylglycerol synthase transmembrane domain-containing protein [Ruminococcus flavefaciens]|uniref:lysylphosphatidylglycerol synthase transmembrane domain-containing protein n=1 Tax=Ruminococcus flavefaciens TaxID=1265 RepID=UPI0026F0E8A0|nr:lysylphosphatidylglycerol synthase transmembrane domain-containing protein [Ruminococcus flavefaciens]